MATIVAVCPYCRVGGIRAPESAVGASAKCPKCGSSFTLMPSSGAPGWAAANAPPAASPTPAQTPAARAATPTPASPSIAEETRPTAAITDDTIPAKPKKKKRKKPRETDDEAPEPEPQPAPVAAPAHAVEPEEEDDDDATTDFGLVVALSALALVGLAVLATLFPFGRFIAAALAGLGMVGGLASLGAEGRARTAGAVACGLHGMILFVVVLFPSWAGLSSWREMVIKDEPPAPQAFSHAPDHKTSIAQWVDSSSASWQYKDMRVTVVSATVGPIEMVGPKEQKGLSKENYLQLVVRIKNIGVERGIDLTGWATGQTLDGVQLSDSTSRPLKEPQFEGEWRPEPPESKPFRTLYPDKNVDVRMLFVAPQPRIDHLRLVLPGTVFGFQEEIKFQINTGSLIQMNVQRAPRK